MKKELRKAIKQRYRELDTDQRARISRRATEFLLDRLSELSEGTKVGFFLSMWDELDTSYLINALMEEGRLQILIPRVEGDEMQFYPYNPTRVTIVSEYGIMEPNNPFEDAEVPTVMIVPGIAFDLKGGRVGRGKGFYDKYFSRCSGVIELKIAFVAGFQIVDNVPMDEHDIPVDEIVTDGGPLLISSR